MTHMHTRIVAMRKTDIGIWLDRLRAPLLFAPVALLGFGLLYALIATGLGAVLFPDSARGSLLMHEGTVVGSRWVGQAFADPKYFQPRPSASGYDAMAMAGSNLAPSNPQLGQRTAEARASLAARDGVLAGQVPGDLLTASGSGIDPHISPQGAQAQVERIARSRGLTPAAVRALMQAHVEPPWLGMIGEPRVNVLELNLALDRLQALK